ncbi:MAG TPA: hypothetical protein VEQ40_09915, partial [Pyrinomonadaceae bacterium]|nr:hypothetical protein [Pyrinomonadaceae bacterium]
RSDALGVMAGDGKILIYKREAKRHQVVTSVNAPAARSLHLRMTVRDGYNYRFAYSIDGRDWKEIGEPVSGGYMEGVRIALTVGGVEGASGKFEWLRVTLNP